MRRDVSYAVPVAIGCRLRIVLLLFGEAIIAYAKEEEDEEVQDVIDHAKTRPVQFVAAVAKADGIIMSSRCRREELHTREI